MSEKDYKKYAYFVSRAKNFAISMRPDKKKIVDGEVVFEEGLRLEFHNGMLRVEKTEENEGIISKLREKIEKEKDLDQKRKSFFEEVEPEAMIPQSKVEDILEKKNREIAELKTKLEQKKGVPAPKKE